MNSTPLFATKTDNCVSKAERSYRVALTSYRVLDTTTIANQELNEYLESQVNYIAPEIAPIVPKIIQVEKIGITRNSSSTPYLVYTIENRRRCTFFKRKVLFHLLQAFLRAYYKIEDKIRAVICTDCFDLKVMLGQTWQTLFKSDVTLFVEYWNNRILGVLMPDCEPLNRYRTGARSLLQRHNQHSVVISSAVEKLVVAMRNAIAYRLLPAGIDFDTRHTYRSARMSKNLLFRKSLLNFN